MKKESTSFVKLLSVREIFFYTPGLGGKLEAVKLVVEQLPVLKVEHLSGTDKWLIETV